MLKEFSVFKKSAEMGETSHRCGHRCGGHRCGGHRCGGNRCGGHRCGGHRCGR